MNKLYLVVALVWAVTGCNALTKPTATSLKGTYHITAEKRGPFVGPNSFELTGTKFIATIWIGEVSQDYEVEDNYLYVNSAGTKYRFTIVSPDTLRAEAHSPFEGTYVKVKQ